MAEQYLVVSRNRVSLSISLPHLTVPCQGITPDADESQQTRFAIEFRFVDHDNTYRNGPVVSNTVNQSQAACRLRPAASHWWTHCHVNTGEEKLKVQFASQRSDHPRGDAKICLP